MSLQRRTVPRLLSIVIVLASGMLVLECADAVRGHVQAVRERLTRESLVLVSAAANPLEDFDETEVIGVAFKGVERAYPLILPKHVNNDTLGDLPVAVSYCDLQQSCAVHVREYDGRVLNLVMNEASGSGNLMDAETGQRWVQRTGTSYDGKKPLNEIPTVVQKWKQWRTSHPNTEIAMTPAILDQTVAPARLSAELWTPAGLAAMGDVLGGKLAGPAAVVMIAFILLSVAMLKLSRQLRMLRGDVDALQNDKAHDESPAKEQGCSVSSAPKT